MVQRGSQILYTVMDVDDTGFRGVESTASLVSQVTDAQDLTGDDTPGSTAPLRDGGLPPQAVPYVDELAFETFGVTANFDPDTDSHARLKSAKANGRRVVIRFTRYDEKAETVGTLDYVSIVTGVTEIISRGNAHSFTFTFAVVPYPGPYPHIFIGPFTLAAGDSRSVLLDRYFTNADSYAIGTLDPASNASASAVYTAGTKTLTITADASRTGRTRIPVTASATGQADATYTISVVV